MKVTADANILLRVALQDDAEQAAAAEMALRDAEVIAITLPAFCEFAWVLRRGYKQSRSQIESAIRAFVEIDKVSIDHAAVAAGLAMLAKGGDFADGVIAFEGRRLGGSVYLTFDKKAASLIARAGGQSTLLAGKA